MEEIQGMKMKMTAIKVGQMEQTLFSINLEYMQTIQELRKNLNQKT